jgi:hypothetical protein
MVSAVHGALLTCDVPLKEIVKSINAQQDVADRFIIAELKDGNLFIKADKADFVQRKVKAHLDALHYTPPDAQQRE